jgi:hypothetical protein
VRGGLQSSIDDAVLRPVPGSPFRWREMTVAKR